MRRESADFIGARSEAGCNKAGCRAAAHPIRQSLENLAQWEGTLLRQTEQAQLRGLVTSLAELHQQASLRQTADSYQLDVRPPGLHRISSQEAVAPLG